jgi:N-acetylmuramoyl-L-alanine amidase
MKYHRHRFSTKFCLAVLLAGAFVAGCKTERAPRPGARLERKGDEIMVAGQLFHTGAPVVLWTDPGGYDAYRVERRFVPWEKAGWEATTREAASVDRPDAPARYGLRQSVLTDEEIEQVRGGGWPLELLQQKVDQFVLHYDVAGTSKVCFDVLHDRRGLSVQFMIDVDGTIYQTCDLKERAWHATIANSRSVGVEIAHMGAYQSVAGPLSQWYQKDENGVVRMNIPEARRKWLRNPDYQGRPARQELVAGKIHGTQYVQYDFTPEQYDSLIKLTAALCTALPKIQCDHPRDENGELLLTNLTPEQFAEFQGVLGHYHVQRNKQDPGPAMQWDRVIREARKLMSPEAIRRMEAERGKPVKNVRSATQPSAPPVTQPTTRPGGRTS